MTDRDRVGRTALAELLETGGLCGARLCTRVAARASKFPTIVQRNIFLEYELSAFPAVAGMGVGFPAGVLEEYAVTNRAFLQGATGLAIQAAMSNDPFAKDHEAYVNARSDRDPDWVEYDVSGDEIEKTPFVFFRSPSRHRTIRSRSQINQVCQLLAVAPSAEFAILLRALVDSGPIVLYRVGVAHHRGPGWRRLLISHLCKSATLLALTWIGSIEFARVIEASEAFYGTRADAPGALYSLSLDVNGGQLSALDVECPYLFRVKSSSHRSEPFRAYLDLLVSTGHIDVNAAHWLSHFCTRTIDSGDRKSALSVSVHHLKHRLMGEPRGRAKAYLHLEALRGAASGAHEA